MPRMMSDAISTRFIIFLSMRIVRIVSTRRYTAIIMAKRRKREGRPATGPRVGERVSDYSRLTVRVPKRVVDLLAEMAAKEERPQWKVVADAIGERADRVLK